MDEEIKKYENVPQSPQLGEENESKEKSKERESKLIFSASISKQPTQPRKSRGEKEKRMNTILTDNAKVQALSEFISPGFRTNIFACFGDPIGCLLTCCMPCVPSSANRSAVDERDIEWTDCMPCLWPNAYQTRQSIRAKYRMEVYPWNDCFAAICCGMCVVNQNTREIAEREDQEPVFYQIPGRKAILQRDMSQAMQRVSLTETR